MKSKSWGQRQTCYNLEEVDGFRTKVFHCSNCGWWSSPGSIKGDDTHESDEGSYCPHCGAAIIHPTAKH